MSEIISLGTAAARVMRGLTEAQKKQREGKFTGTCAKVVMNGDCDEIYKLWLELTGQKEPDDLSGNISVQLGLVTEAYNLELAEGKIGEQIVDRQAFIQHSRYDWAACTIDGVFRECMDPIEAKYHGQFCSFEELVARHQPQMQWQMECLATTRCALSVLFGRGAHVIEWIPRDEEYAAELVRRGEQFMAHVRNRTPPVELPPVTPPIVPVRSYDMSTSNSWASDATRWLENRLASNIFKISEHELKAKTPPDAKNAHGHGVIVTRDRAGRLSIKPYSGKGVQS